MKVLIVGHGGRETALAWKIAQSPQLTKLIVTAPNPGWPEGVVVSNPAAAGGLDALVLESAVDLVVIGPEAPLAEGLSDQLRAEGVSVFGPSRAAARLETSKAFTKTILRDVGVPTSDFLVVTRGQREEAEARCRRGNVAVKVDGLAAGKGVFVCPTADEALAALDEAWSRFGSAADTLVLEDLVRGFEVSLFALTDGERVVPLVTAQDHKRIGDGDTGPNTGGMGAYAPCPLVDPDTAAAWVEQIHVPVIREMKRRGTPYRGVLFAGLMVEGGVPSVLEFNVRFGDPECQVLMPLWEGDVLPWLVGAARGELPEGRPGIRDGSACCVVLASAGYPTTSTKGVLIPEPLLTEDVVVFHAGTRREADGLKTNGGRVLGITGVGDSLEEAHQRAYESLEGWRFEGCQFRTDIAARALHPGQ